MGTVEVRRRHGSGRFVSRCAGGSAAARFCVSVGPDTFRRWQVISREQQLRVNEQIRVREVLVVTDTGEKLGVMQVRDALRAAAERGLDLVEIAPLARPPVCKIMDFGKFKYEQSKRERETRKKQKIVDIKEIKMRPTIEEHDFEVRARNAEKFLKEGDKIKATIMFRGRQITHPELGKAVLDKLAERLKDIAVIERAARLEGRNMIMFLTPKHQPAEKPERPERRPEPQAAAEGAE